MPVKKVIILGSNNSVIVGINDNKDNLCTYEIIQNCDLEIGEHDYLLCLCSGIQVVSEIVSSFYVHLALYNRVKRLNKTFTTSQVWDCNDGIKSAYTISFLDESFKFAKGSRGIMSTVLETPSIINILSLGIEPSDCDIIIIDSISDGLIKIDTQNNYVRKIVKFEFKLQKNPKIVGGEIELIAEEIKEDSNLYIIADKRILYQANKFNNKVKNVIKMTPYEASINLGISDYFKKDTPADVLFLYSLLSESKPKTMNSNQKRSFFRRYYQYATLGIVLVVMLYQLFDIYKLNREYEFLYDTLYVNDLTLQSHQIRSKNTKVTDLILLNKRVHSNLYSPLKYISEAQKKTTDYDLWSIDYNLISLNEPCVRSK